MPTSSSNMRSLAEQTCELYTDVWQTVEPYGDTSPGGQLVPRFLEMADLVTGRGRTVLDMGCGNGKGATALVEAEFAVTMADVTDAGLPEGLTNLIPFRQACVWDDLRASLGYVRGGKFDYVYCCDVLAHVPLPFTMLAVSRMLDMTRRGLFLSMGLQADVHGFWVGRSLHQSVQSFTEWRDQLNAIGTVQEARDWLHTGLYYVVPT